MCSMEKGREGGEREQRRDILQRMMNNPKVHRYYTQTMKRGEVMAGSEGRVVEGGLAWLLLAQTYG